MKARDKFTLFGLIAFLVSGCSSVLDLSKELPYEDMVGACYVLQQDMNIIRTQRNCSAMGDEIITPYLRAFCLSEKVGDLAKGSEVIISGVRIRKTFEYNCATLDFEITGATTSAVEAFSAPLCEMVQILDWRQGEHRPSFRRGDIIELREDYVKPCGE